MADKDKPGVTAPSESTDIPISQNANRLPEKPVLFGASDDSDKPRLGSSDYKPSPEEISKFRNAVEGVSLKDVVAGLSAIFPTPSPPVGEEKRSVREALGEARRISDERDVIRDNPAPPKIEPKREPDTPSQTHSGFDGAVLAVSELLFLLFGLPFGDALYHGNVTALHWVYLAIAITCAIGGPMWPAMKNKWASPHVAASVANAARDARVWIALLLAFFLYSVAPEMYQRAVKSAAVAPSMDGFTQQQVEEKIAIATSALKAQLETAKENEVLLQKQLGEVRGRQSVYAAPANGLPSLTIERQRALLSAFANLKSQLPTVVITIPTANGSRPWAMELFRIFERVGITPMMAGQNPRGPDETGLMIAVRDPKALSEVATKLLAIFESTGLKPKVVQMAPDIAGEFAIFVGPDPL